ncbi:hypothetical protein [Nonomuraea ceibae]|uniref:hypothetical protein n=1 Tax=Nonomuraea ceibae TaxID=1935170 RepID=UPI001C5FCC02|nr:hypothetical protein [Nonomuraea ceibae]
MAVRRFPSGSDYVEALQNPGLCFLDTTLRSATLQTDKLGRPKPISGNFASVFSVQTSAGKRYAVKCFTRDVPDQERRYRAVSDHLRPLPNRWKMGFDYLPSGIMVLGQRYPILRMEWIEAISLIRWIEDHLNDQAALFGLAGRFADLATDLHEAGVAHGDLQHGNLLVAADGTLKLVDYDGMYVPALNGFAATERGHRHYQSPNRTGTDFGPELDRFSIWLIYLSLIAVALDPTLWQILHDRGGEHLLLTDEDFADTRASTRMAALVGHQMDDINRLATFVGDLASRPLSVLPPLTPLQTVTVSPVSLIQTGGQTPGSVPAGLPTWMSGHMESPPPPPLVTFQNHRGALRVARLALLGFCVAMALVVWLAGLPLAAALVGPFLGLLAIRAVYATRPEPRARKAIASRLARSRRQARKTLKMAANAEKARDRVQARNVKRAEANAKELQVLQERQKRELGTFDRATAQQLNPFDGQLQILTSRKSDELRHALEVLQGQQVTLYLRRIKLRAGSISGIGETTVAKLAVCGISTPADFVGAHVATGHQNPEIRLTLQNGDAVRVPGVGQARAAALLEWRETHLREAMRQPSIPRVLPTVQRNAIEARFAAEEASVLDKRSRLQQERGKARADLARRQVEALRKLTDQHSADVQSAAQALQDANQRLSATRAEQQARVQEEQSVIREVTAYRQISYVRFLRDALVGK